MDSSRKAGLRRGGANKRLLLEKPVSDVTREQCLLAMGSRRTALLEPAASSGWRRVLCLGPAMVAPLP